MNLYFISQLPPSTNGEKFEHLLVYWLNLENNYLLIISVK
jgi:hypothetical protein